jgi:hypothetical protein
MGEMRTIFALVLAGTLSAGSLVVAGCGGGSEGPGVASVGEGGTTTTAQSGTRDGLRYAACMRSHGVRNFPDPDTNGVTPDVPGMNKRSPTYLVAARECRAYAAGGQLTAQQEAELQQRMLRFASCMRAHGVPAFPDPVVGNGRIDMRLPNGQGLDRDSPRFRAAQTACQSRLDPRYVRKLVGGTSAKPTRTNKAGSKAGNTGGSK